MTSLISSPVARMLEGQRRGVRKPETKNGVGAFPADRPHNEGDGELNPEVLRDPFASRLTGDSVPNGILIRE